MAGLTHVDTDERPERATAMRGPNRNGGRDLVISDLHGHFRTLEHALETLDFDATADRLFSAGDLIDHGPESERAVEWLQSGRITAAVRGNHEQMMAAALAFDATLRLRTIGPAGTWLSNGAHWWYDSEEVSREREREGPARAFPLAERWAKALARLPYMMVVETELGRVGIVHASGFANAMRCWDVIWEDAERLSAPKGNNPTTDEQRLDHRLVWYDGEHFAEDRDAPELPTALPDIDLVITGHSPGEHARWTRANVLCIDSGLSYPEWGHLTVAELGRELTLHRFARKEETGSTR